MFREQNPVSKSSIAGILLLLSVACVAMIGFVLILFLMGTAIPEGILVVMGFVSITFAMLTGIYFSSDKIQETQDYLEVAVFRVVRKRIHWSDIEKVTILTENERPFNTGMVYSVDWRGGIAIKLRDGSSILAGTRMPERWVSVIDSHTRSS